MKKKSDPNAPQNTPEPETPLAPEEMAPEAEPPAEAAPEELDKLREECAALSDRYLRTLAEYDNFRKRSAREKENLYVDATAAAVTQLLPILDNFERAVAMECADAEFKKGLDMIAASFAAVFEKLGVSEIPALGESFDPLFHNAVMHVEDDSAGENVVVEVFARGYRLGDRVLRCSMVKVAN